MRHDNRPANKKILGGELDKKWWRIARQRQCVKRTRGGGIAMTGVMQQPAGKQEANWRGGISRQEAAEH